MGMFDTVKYQCPTCQEKMSYQTKSGPCRLEVYRASSVPAYLTEQLMEEFECSKGHKFKFRIQGFTEDWKLNCVAYPVEEEDDNVY